MDWTPLPRGPFTGIDWSAPGQADGMDPYLAWAEATRFAGCTRKGGKPPQLLPLVFELRSGKTARDLQQASDPRWLQVRPAYLAADAPAGLRYCTALAAAPFFREFRRDPLAQVIERFELGLPNGLPPPAMHRGKASAPARLQGKVLGVIDGGLAFANAAFLRDGQARTRFFWRQDSHGVGDTPAGFGYGHELTAAQIDAEMDRCRHHGMVDEAEVYRRFGLFDLQRRVNHGTHVTDIESGPLEVTARLANLPPDLDAPPSWRPADDAASRAGIVAVQLDWHTILDTSGGSMNVHILDGLLYILSRCEASAQVSVNISWGTLAGPHDGSSILEAAMDQLIELSGGRLSIAVPAGNSYQSRTHANDLVPPGQTRRLTWCVQADDFTQSFLELWLAGAGGPLGAVGVRVTPPGCEPLPWMPLGQCGMWTDTGKQPLCALIFPRKVATGTTGTCALLALAPSASFQADRATAPCGRWTVELRNDGTEPLVFDAYIERDDVPIGLPGPGGRQSYFTDALYDTSGNPGAFVDHPDNPTLIRRSGNFNSISTGARTVAVGGVRVNDGSWAWYSPRDPDPDHARPGRPGVVKVPSARAFSDESAAAQGLPASGTMSGSVVRLVGTSSAAPQAARRWLDGTGGPQATSAPAASS